MNQTTVVIREAILTGQVANEDLSAIYTALKDRARDQGVKLVWGNNEPDPDEDDYTPPPFDWRKGVTVELTQIRPKYLVGRHVQVTKVNDKTVVCDFPNEPGFGRYAGHRNVRVPKSGCKVVKV